MNDESQDTSAVAKMLADPDFWERPPDDRLKAFADLRKTECPAFIPEQSTRGSYALVHHRDVIEASRNSKTFSSEPGVTTPEPTPLVRFLFGDSMVNLDNPRHGRLRKIVANAFTPRQITRLEDDMAAMAKEVVDDLIAERPTDFVSSAATDMPFKVLCKMMGIPANQQPKILRRVNQSGESSEARNAFKRIRIPGRATLAVLDMQLMMRRFARDKRRRPTDDILSALVNTEVDGKRLSGRELGSFFELLVVAGVETTRNAIAHGLRLLTDHPDQRALLVSDLDKYLPGAIEEIIRYETPIIQFRRTVTEDTEVGGCPMHRGDKVTMFYTSANRDEAVFGSPDTFDIARDPNPHVGFGGGGAHVCLGKGLARSQMAALYREMYTRLPDIASVGEPEMVASNFDNRLKRLSFTF